MAVRNIFQRIKILVMSRYLNAAFPTLRAVEIASAGIIKNAAVNDQVIVVKPFIHWAGGGSCKITIITFCQSCSALSAESQCYSHAVCRRSEDAKPYISLRINRRIILKGLVKAGRFRIF